METTMSSSSPSSSLEEEAVGFQSGMAGRRVSRVLHSPTSQQAVLFSNDDQLERAQSRAARAAASRRKSLISKPPPCEPSPDLFARDQVLQLLHNCIKLASENKINQRNTWELGLIDHLSEIIRTETRDEDSETNFQKASCTLEAGVKIYSLRVDSTHSEAYKVLGGINRVGREDNKENVAENGQNDVGEESIPKKDQGRKLSPLSTLESSFDALNIKKFDVAFAVDPLYHQTSAQFDEGGARGLLLSNLGVYSGCKVLFDSLETPGNCMISENASNKSESIDLNFAKDIFEQMVNSVSKRNEISPTLRDIINQFNEDNQRPPNVFSETLESGELDDLDNTNGPQYEAETAEHWNGENDDQASVVDDESTNMHTDFAGDLEENGDCVFPQFAIDDRVEKIAGFLSLGLGLNCKANAWAGPEHWKYQKAKGFQSNADATSDSKEMLKKNKRQDASVLEFAKFLDTELPNVFLPPKNIKTLLLPANRASCNKNITLPEDCHYQPESLVKLFLLPNVMCFGKKKRTFEETRQLNDMFESVSGFDDYFDDGNAPNDLENLGDLVSQPRQIQKLDVKYDKLSKQVDVHALKTALWDRILICAGRTEMVCDSPISFQHVFGCLRNQGMVSQSGISPHLSLICLLHLANEHCLRIHDRPTLDELDIYVPTSLTVGNH